MYVYDKLLIYIKRIIKLDKFYKMSKKNWIKIKLYTIKKNLHQVFFLNCWMVKKGNGYL